MKYISIVLLFLTLHATAQNELIFDKRFVQCEDKWIAFKPDKDTAYALGFIYIDEQVGFVIDLVGNFKESSTGKFVVKKFPGSSVRMRLEPDNVMVAHIPGNRFEELEIEETPEWLAAFKTDSSSADHLYKWGFMYNGWNECATGLSYLQRLQKLEPKYDGLVVELAYSYNCLGQFSEAEALLENEILNNSKDAYIHKEFIYTLAKNKKIDLAIKQFRKSVNTLTDHQYDAENCFNILQFYYENNDSVNFNLWYKEFKKIDTENKDLKIYASQMKAEMK